MREGWAGVEWCTCTYFHATTKNREKPGKSKCEACCKIEPSKSRQKTLMCFSDRGQSKNVFSIQKKTLAGWSSWGWRWHWDCWAVITLDSEKHDL